MINLAPPLDSTVDLLIVDEDGDLRELLRFYFNTLGYRTEAAAMR